MKRETPYHRFLNGELTEYEYLKEIRLEGILAGFMFGSMMMMIIAILFFWIVPSIPAAIGGGAIGGTVGGITFGLGMYLWLRSVAKQTIVAYREREKRIYEHNIDPRFEHTCPICGDLRWKKIDWKEITMLHWVLNPGLALNELLLGQRVPKEMYQCRTCQSYFVICSHCRTQINAMEWSGKKAFFQWEGLRCPKCNGTISCLRNIFAASILCILWPFICLAQICMGKKDHKKI